MITSSTIKRFQDLTTWRVAHSLVLQTYKMTRSFPSHERFALGSQMNRSAVSITSNIAEGFGRYSRKEKLQFYTISRGSLHELENQIILTLDLGYVDRIAYDEARQTIMDVHRLLNALIQKTKQFQMSDRIEREGI